MLRAISVLLALLLLFLSTTIIETASSRVSTTTATAGEEASSEDIKHAATGGGSRTAKTNRTTPSFHSRNEKGLHPIQQEMLPFVEDMLEHAVDGYLSYAFPHDELKPLSASYGDGMGLSGVYTTLIDMLDTIALMNRPKLFRRLARWVEEKASLNKTTSVSVFETNIRVVGGLLSAHYVYEEGIVPVVPAEHDYQGGLLRLAMEVADRLLPAFDTPTGLPYGSINLRRGVAPGETMESGNAATGTYLMEFASLSKASGDPKYEAAARRASQAVFDLRDGISSLMGHHLNISTGWWTIPQCMVGSGIDSTVEYFLKSHAISGEPGEWWRFESSRRAFSLHTRVGGMYQESRIERPMITRAWHNSLGSYYAGVLVQGGHRTEAAENLWSIQRIMRAYGGIPETFSMSTNSIVHDHGRHPLRPEHIESIYYMYRATRDPVYLEMGKEFALALHLRTRTAVSFATVSDLSAPITRAGFIDSMESFFISETLKYLYLLFDECNVLHLQSTASRLPPSCAASAEKMRTAGSSPHSRVGWVFTTEAHIFPNHGEWWGERAAEGTRSNNRRAPHGLVGTAEPSWSNAYSREVPDCPAATTTTTPPTSSNTAKLKKLHAAEDERWRHYTESLRARRQRHLRGMLAAVKKEMAASGERGSLRYARDVPTNTQQALEQHTRKAESTILYEYYCRNHVAVELDRLSPSILRTGISPLQY